MNAKEIWIGLVEVRSLEGGTVLEDAKGAFVHIVTWAEDANEYRSKTELVLSKLHVFVVDIKCPEPVSTRRNRKGDFEDGIEDIIASVENNPNAIMYGRFHLNEKDDS